MDFDNLSEKELLNTCIQGSKEAWDAFVEKYTKLIYHSINKTFRTYSADFLYHDKDDIHNSVFLSLIENDYRKLRQYEGKNGCTVSSWLALVTNRFTINHIKKAKRSKHIEGDPPGNVDVRERVSNPQPQPGDELSVKESLEILKELVNNLKVDDKLFIKLYYEKELPPEEIAEILKCEVSTIYSRKNRIKEKLQKIAKKKNLLQDN